MKKNLFICAMLFVSSQAINAEKSTSIDFKDLEWITTEESAVDVMEAPSVNNIEECQEAVTRFITSCGKGMTIVSEEELSDFEISYYIDFAEAAMCSEDIP